MIQTLLTICGRERWQRLLFNFVFKRLLL
jgi:hypothetical protein